MSWEKIKIWILNNILTLLTIIIPACGSICVAIMGSLSGELTKFDIFLIGLLLFIIFILLIKSIWNKVSYKSYQYPWSKIRTSYNYEILEKTVTYKRDDSDVLEYNRCIKIKSLSNRLNYAVDKYIWTGTQQETAQIAPIEGISNIKDMSRIGIWHYFIMIFENHMERGETKVLSYAWPKIEECKKSSPFFSASTDEPTKKLSLIIELGSEYANQEIICEEFRAVESDYPISKTITNLDDRGVYRWDISGIKRFRHYRIRWSWSKGKNAAEITD